jgi:hypothetical protein
MVAKRTRTSPRGFPQARQCGSLVPHGTDLPEAVISFLRHFLGGTRPDAGAHDRPDGDVHAPSSEPGAAPVAGHPAPAADSGPPTSAAHPTPAKAVRRPAAAACPYCAVLLDPPPERGRLCPRCRRPIVVRRVDGRRVLLTRDAVEVFTEERSRQVHEHELISARRHWLALAAGVSAPEKRVARLESSLPSSAVVVSSRELYLRSAEQAVRAAKREKRWREVARVRHEQAAVLYREAGTPKPPPDDILALHRAWSDAALRALVGFGPMAELVSSGCCRICNKDDERQFRIAAELKEQRLPHAGCPKGLCGCDWAPLPRHAARSRRVPKRPARPAQPTPPEPAAATDDAEPAAGLDSAGS